MWGGMDDDNMYGEQLSNTDDPNCPTADPCDDWLYGGFGADALFGGPGNDSLNGDITFPLNLFIFVENAIPTEWLELEEPLPEFGDDRIHGNHGNDYLKDPGNTSTTPVGDQMWGGEGNDVIIGGENNDHLLGGPGDDEIWGRGGVDSIQGDDLPHTGGNDKLYGGAERDFLSVGDLMLGGEGGARCRGDDNQFEIDCDDAKK
jgi:Ca2+-binding RTX toxin-like protein